jgi:tetratricopeptide (TPR) repeat protein
VSDSDADRFTVVRLEDVEGYAEEGRPRWHMLRSTLGISSFGINAWRATEPGQQMIGDHDELGDGAGGHEELYLVVSGRATFTVDGETIDAPTGTIVFVRDPAVKRAAMGQSTDTAILVVGGKPGEPFTVSEWETSAEALRYWTTQEWDRAIELLSRRQAEIPESAGVAYNLACAESRGGRPDDAVAHLVRAIELRPSFAASAQDDPDFAPIRDRADFPHP